MNKFLFFIGLIAFGYIQVRYHKWIKENVPIQMRPVENFFGPGGMYTFWKLTGIATIIFAFYFLFNM